MSKHISRWAWVAFFLSMAALPLYAQHGCVDSPENPTAILGLVGAAGFFYSPVKNKLASLWRGRRKG
ncbi:MAG TPA: PExPT-CTERM protein [Terriglobales bacterium]|nr:PExPT-CTERM protein [Terriglobales bacterium]